MRIKLTPAFVVSSRKSEIKKIKRAPARDAGDGPSALGPWPQALGCPRSAPERWAAVAMPRDATMPRWR
jgi:hypothetical protein